MRRILFIFVAGTMALAECSFASSPGDDAAGARASSSNPTRAAAADVPPMPRMPRGVSTILGGSIRNVDPVLDRFTLDIYGEHPMTIFFDERTHVFRDGVKIPLLDLGPANHVSVQTALDGTRVFAESVHILSKAPEGETRGMVRSFNPSSGRLYVESDLSPKPVRFLVPRNTPIQRVGQPEFTAAKAGQLDLRRGSLISITFAPDLNGRAIVRSIKVLAVPGSAFMFGGNVTYLDLSSGSLVLVNSRDGKNYRIYFNPSQFPSTRNLRVGDNISVSANYEGTRYVANSIKIN